MFERAKLTRLQIWPFVHKMVLVHRDVVYEYLFLNRSKRQFILSRYSMFFYPPVLGFSHRCSELIACKILDLKKFMADHLVKEFNTFAEL